VWKSFFKKRNWWAIFQFIFHVLKEEAIIYSVCSFTSELVTENGGSFKGKKMSFSMNFKTKVTAWCGTIFISKYPQMDQATYYTRIDHRKPSSNTLNPFSYSNSITCGLVKKMSSKADIFAYFLTKINEFIGKHAPFLLRTPPEFPRALGTPFKAFGDPHFQKPIY